MCMRRKFAGNCPTKSQGRFAALLMASEDVGTRMARKRSLNESMLGSLVGQSKTLTVLEFSRDKLPPQFVGATVSGATGGCDGMLILSLAQQGYWDVIGSMYGPKHCKIVHLNGEVPSGSRGALIRTDSLTENGRNLPPMLPPERPQRYL